MDPYSQHEHLVAPARPSAGLGGLFLGTALIVLGFLVLNTLYLSFLQTLAGGHEFLETLNTGNSATAIWSALASFLMIFPLLWLALNGIHSRTLRSLVGQPGQALDGFRRVFLAVAALFILVALIPVPATFSPTQDKSVGLWLSLIPLSLVLIFFQVAAEELFFRGYLQSQLAAQFSSPLIWIGVPSVLFGLLHYSPGETGDYAIWRVGLAILFGLATADLTARSGTLGPAMALHMINNLSGLLWTSFQDYWDGLALFVLPFGPGDTDALAPLMAIEVLILLCGWLAARIALRR